MSVKDRMIFYLEKKGISPTKAESNLGWSKGALLKAKSVSSDRLEEFILLYNDISPEWLLSGEGGMTKTDSKGKTNENNSPLELNTINLKDMESLMSMLKEALSDLRKEREYVHKYHEEIVALKNEVEELKVQLSEKDDIINHLRKGEMDYGKAMVN